MYVELQFGRRNAQLSVRVPPVGAYSFIGKDIERRIVDVTDLSSANA